MIIDETGTVTLPPDLLVRLGGAGRYTVGNINSGYISLQGESVESMGKMVLASTCPACKHDYKDSDEQLCPSCGSSSQWWRPSDESVQNIWNSGNNIDNFPILCSDAVEVYRWK